MDELLESRLNENALKFRSSLARIADKYSKLQHQDAGIDVDLDNVPIKALQTYMTESKKHLSLLEAKSLTDLREESFRAQDITGDSQLDFTYQDGGADETSDSTRQFSVEDDDNRKAAGMTRSDVTQLTVSSLDESQKTFSEIDLQPEDQDEELEMSLRSAGSSLVELYPGMISRIERACHRQNVSVAAHSVLRRYRRWRQQSNRSINNTFADTQRHTNSTQKQMTSKESSSSPVKRQFMRTEPKPSSPLQRVTSLYNRQPEQQSPGKGGGLLRERQQPILLMDFSDPPETSKPKEISLNKTFTICQLSPPKVYQRREQTSTYTASPSRPFYPAAKASTDQSLGFKKFPLSAQSIQSAGCSVYAPGATAVKERPDIYSSPVRQSPLKARMMTSLTTSPRAFSRSPKEYPAEHYSREPVRHRSLSICLSSPAQKAAVPPRRLYRQDSHQFFQPHLRSPQSATAAEGRHRLRRHLSFDSSLPSVPASYSPKKVDEEFMKLYHKFVCQSKSAFFNSQPCRLCARNSEASRGHSSSALAALALSPHRSVLRKRHRELGWDSHPQSKRFREEYGTYSPGSRRHSKEMLRRCLSPSELKPPHGGLSTRQLSYSPSKHGMFQRVSTQQPPAHQEAWMSQRQLAADFQGGSLEREMANGYYPRKWP